MLANGSITLVGDYAKTDAVVANISLTNATLHAGTFISASTTGDIVATTGSSIIAGTTIDLNAGGNIDVTDSTLTAPGNISATAGLSIAVTRSTITSSGGSVSLTANGGTVTLTNAAVSSFVDITIVGSGNVIIQTGPPQTQLTAGRDIGVTAGGALTITGSALAAGRDIHLTALGGDVTESSSTSTAAHDAFVQASNDVAVHDSSVTAGNLASFTAIGGNLLFDGSTTVSAAAILIQAGGDVHLTATTTLDARDTIDIYGDYQNGPAGLTHILLEGTMQGRAPPLNSPTISVYGNSGPDVITLRPVFVYGQVYIWGRDGADQITVDQMPTLDLTRKYLAGVTGPASLVTTGFQSATIVRFTVNLDGQGGGDSYVVNTTGRQRLHRQRPRQRAQPADGVDTLTINGTRPQSNVFLLRAAVRRAHAADRRPGCRQLRAGLRAGQLRLVDQRARGQRRHRATTTSTSTTTAPSPSLDGGAGDDSFQFGQMFGADRTQPNVAPGDEIATVLTTVGYLSRGISYATTAYGGDGDDTFTVYSNKAPLKLFGEDGNDTFIVRAFLIVGTNAVATTDTLVNGGAGDDNIEYNINAPVSIDGGAGVDTVVVIGTEANDNFVITKDGVMGAGLNVHYTNVEKVEVDGLEGNDNFYVLSTDPNVITVARRRPGQRHVRRRRRRHGTIVALNAEARAASSTTTSRAPTRRTTGIFAPGVPVQRRGRRRQGQVVIQQNAGGTSVVQDGPARTDQTSYTVSLASVAPPTPTTIWYVTVAAAPDSVQRPDAGRHGRSSSRPTASTGSPSLVLTFDGSAAAGSVDDARRRSTSVPPRRPWPTGDATIEIMHSIQSTTPIAALLTGFATVTVSNVDVKVIDDDQPGLIVTTPPSGHARRRRRPAPATTYTSS